MAVLKRTPLILLFLFLFLCAWVFSPLWVKSLPVSTQQTLAGSTNLANKANTWLTGLGQPHQKSFKPRHYIGVPKGASFIQNFSVDMNVDSNMVAHPILKLNGNVITPPRNDISDSFQITYPGQKRPTPVSEATWIAYFKAHPKMFVQAALLSGATLWTIGDNQWWTKEWSGKVMGKGTTFLSSSSASSKASLLGAQLSGVQSYTVQ